jgi:hypothetical protein
MNTTEKAPDDREMTDAEMVQAILQSPGTLTLWAVKGDRQTLVAEIPVPRRKVRARRKR